MAHFKFSNWAVRRAVAIVLRYGLAIGSVAAALGMTLILMHYGLPRLFASFSFVAIAVCFWYAGTGPGLVAVLLSCLALEFFLRRFSAVRGLGWQFFLASYAVFAALVGWFSASRRRAERLLAEARDNLEKRIAERTRELSQANEELQMEVNERKRAEDARRESEEWIRRSTEQHLQETRALIDAIPQLIWSGPADGSNDFCNERLCSYTGLSPKELQGTGWERILHPDDRERVLRAWQESVEKGTPYEQEERHRGADGKYRWFLNRGVPVRNAEGRIVRWYGTHTDIEELKRAVESLRQSDQRYQDFVSHSHEGVWRLELVPPVPCDLPEEESVERFLDSAYFAECNLAFARNIGQSVPEALVGKRLRDLVLTWDVGRLGSFRSAARGGWQGRTVEFRGLDSLGNPRDLVRTEVPIVENGMLVRIWGITRDVTEIKRAEVGLRESEERFRSMFENAGIGMALVDIEGHPIKCNPALLQMLGYSEKELSGMVFTEFTYADDRELDRELYRALIAGKRDRYEMEKRYIRKDGEVIWGHLVVSLVSDTHGAPAYAVGMVEDITERKRMERSLRRSETYLAASQKISHVGTWCWDVPTREIVFWSDEAYRMFGFGPKPEAVSFQEVLERIHPEDRPSFNKAVEKIGEKENYEIDFRIVLPDGSVRQIHSLGQPIVDESGRVVEHICTHIDMTERRRIEEELRESEGRFKNMADTAPSMIWASGTDKLCTYFNQQWLDFTGRTMQQELGNGWAEGVHPDDYERCLRTYTSAFDRRESFKMEYRLRCADGQFRWIYDTGVPRFSPGREFLGYIGSCIDITERKLTEEIRNAQAVQAEVRAEVSTALAKEGRVESILQGCMEAIVRHLGAAFARVWTLDKSENMLKLQASAGIYNHLDGPHSRVPLGALEIGHIAEGRKPRLTNDVLNDQFIDDKAWVEEEGIVAFAGYPLIVGDRVVGVMAMFSRQRLATSTLDVLASVADAIAQGIERKRAEEDLRVSEAKFRALAESATVAIFIIQGNRFRYANPAMAAITGYSHEELLAMNFWEYVHPDFREMVKECGLARQRGEVVPERYEFKILTKGGEERWLDFSDGKFQLEGKLAVVGMAFDVTDHKRAEEELRKSEERWRAVFENSAVGIALSDLPSTRFQQANTALQEMLGYSEDELRALSFMDLTHAEDREANRRLLEELVEGRRRFFKMQKRYRRKNGDFIWANLHVSLISGATSLSRTSAAVIEDITERKRAEEELQKSRDQLRALAARLQNVREEERTRVAREIHDELGSYLTAIKIDLSSLILDLPAGKKAECDSIIREVDETIRTVRRIATDLRPGILDALGPVAAVEWAAEDFEARTGIKCKLKLPQEEVAIDPQRATTLFRIFQETLTNVTRHANATELEVRLAKENGNLLLEIHDNGSGISDEQVTKGGSLGILGMRERALLLGGELTISGAPGNGTTVRLRIPQSTPPEPERRP